MRFLAATLACVIVAYGLAFYLAVPANPEIQFWRQVVTRRETEIATIRKQSPSTPIIFFTGGSSCAFSIDPAIIEKTCGLPAFNLGLPVAGGARYLLYQALDQTSAGDFLVVCLEPDLLTSPANFKKGSGTSKFSFAMSAAAGHLSAAAGGNTSGRHPTIRDYLNFARPGPSYLTTLAAKALTGRGYRYTPADLRYHGRIETPVRDLAMIPQGISSAVSLSLEGGKLLEMFHAAATNRGVHVFYSMPWCYTAGESVAASRTNKLNLIADISSILPAIDDGFAGVASDPSFFADSALHLTQQGSAIRSQALAAVLQPLLSPQ